MCANVKMPTHKNLIPKSKDTHDWKSTEMTDRNVATKERKSTELFSCHVTLHVHCKFMAAIMIRSTNMLVLLSKNVQWAHRKCKSCNVLEERRKKNHTHNNTTTLFLFRFLFFFILQTERIHVTWTQIQCDNFIRDKRDNMFESIRSGCLICGFYVIDFELTDEYIFDVFGFTARNRSLLLSL